MTCKITNISQRPVSLHLNSGGTLHLSGGAEVDLPSVEVVNNAMCDKLQSRKLLRISPTPESLIQPGDPPKRERPGGEATTPR